MAYKLLLADDSITIQKVVELTLSEEGFDVTAVGDGASALDMAGKLMPDIVLADVFMPKMDGYDLCGRLKADPRLSGVPVMLLVGTFEDYDEGRARKAGADGNLTKPFESAELISRVKALVESARSRPAAPVEGVMEAQPALAEADDLWSVVDMASSEQPLAGATQVMSEEELWQRANLLGDSGEHEAPASVAPAEEAGLSWDELPAEPMVEEAEEVFEAAAVEEEPFPEVSISEEPDTDRTAILDMAALGASYAARDTAEVEPAELSEVSEQLDITPFESLDEATAAVYEPPAAPYPSAPQAAMPAAPAVVPGVSAEELKAEVMRAVEGVVAAKLRDALAGLSREVIEQVVWDVVPELAEEILVREIERLKAGIK